MKRREMNAQIESELVAQLSELKKELMKVNVQLSSGGSVKSPGTVRKIKKTIARVHTRLHAIKTKNKSKEIRGKKSNE